MFHVSGQEGIYIYIHAHRDPCDDSLARATMLSLGRPGHGDLPWTRRGHCEGRCSRTRVQAGDGPLKWLGARARLPKGFPGLQGCHRAFRLVGLARGPWSVEIWAPMKPTLAAAETSCGWSIYVLVAGTAGNLSRCCGSNKLMLFGLGLGNSLYAALYQRHSLSPFSFGGFPAKQ